MYGFTLSKVSEFNDSRKTTMTETWSQALLKEVVVRKTEEALGSFIDQMLARTQALEGNVVE